MGRVAKGAEIGVVRSDDDRAAARCEETVELLHRANHVGYVFDDMDCPHFAKRAVSEWKRVLVEIRNYIGASMLVTIDSDRARILVNSAAHIEDR